MPKTGDIPLRFTMVGARAALLGGPTVESIDQQIEALEQALERVPDFAFDLAKTLVETVCKTVLADQGQTADPNWDCPKLLKETMNRLSFLPANCPETAQTRDAVEKLTRGLLQSIDGLCYLRNHFGVASHGRDGFAVRMGVRQATLAAQSADTIVSFLYLVHRDASQRTPGDRVYYDDHKEFNESFDEENERIHIGDVELLPSRVLYHTDPAAYKDALNEFISEQASTPREEAQASENPGEPA